MAVRVEAFERRIGCLVIPFHDGDAISFQAFRQRAHVSWPCGFEAGTQERGRRVDVRNRVQRKVESVCIADDDRAVRDADGGGPVEAEVIPVPAGARVLLACMTS